MAPKARSCPTQGKIRYDVRTCKPYPGQFQDKDGKQVPKTNTKVKKWNPTVPCPSGTWLLAAKSKRWYGSLTLPESEVTTVKNPDLGYVGEGFNRSNLYAEDCVAVYPPYEPTATLRDPFPWCSAANPDPDPTPDPVVSCGFQPDFASAGYVNRGTVDTGETANEASLTEDPPSVLATTDNDSEPGIIVGESTYLIYDGVTNLSFALNESFTVSFHAILREQAYTSWWCNARVQEGVQSGFSLSRSSNTFGFLMFLNDDDFFAQIADLSALFDDEWHSFVLVYRGASAYEAGAAIGESAVSLYIDGFQYSMSYEGTFPEDPSTSTSSSPVFIGLDAFMIPFSIDGGGPTLSQLSVCAGEHEPDTILGVVGGPGGVGRTNVGLSENGINNVSGTTTNVWRRQ